MKKMSDRYAKVFLAHGIGKGDFVMTILKRHYEYWFTTLALHKIGAILIPATNMLTVKDMIYRINKVQIKAVVCTNEDKVADFVKEAQKKTNLEQVYLVRQDREGFINLTKEAEDSVSGLERQNTLATDPMMVYFTSGTTGEPKAVCHDFTYPLGHIITAKHWQNVQVDKLHMTVAETGWGKTSWGKIYGQWLCGASLFVYDFDKFIAKDLLDRLCEYQVTTFCAPPTIYRFFVKEDLSKWDLSFIRHASTAGEALNLEVFKAFREATGLEIKEAFGQTETTLIIGNLVGDENRPGSMGKPSPLYQIRLVDAENQEVTEPGKTGEIAILPPVSGKQVGLFCSYVKEDELYRFVWRGGLYHTGDTAYWDKDGYLWYVGRNDDIIKSSGYRIGPFEIESCLMENPAVLECAVTGVPSKTRGYLVKATIVLTKGYEPSEQLVKELQDYVKHETAPYKYPRIIEFVSEMPKTISGKIQREVIRQRDAIKYADLD
jgi:acetyl-CoA synthetase